MRSEESFIEIRIDYYHIGHRVHIVFPNRSFLELQIFIQLRTHCVHNLN